MTTTGFRSSVNGAVTTRSAAAPEADLTGSPDPIPTPAGEPANTSERHNEEGGT